MDHGSSLKKGVIKLGYVEIVDGSGYLARIENDQVTIERSTEVCVACNDDRLIHSGNFLVCTQCHCRQ